jgi:phosphate transport system substrate-binding protein
MEHVVSGTYPLARKLYIYVDKPPGKPLTPLVKEFLRFILSKEGQEVVASNGFVPLTGPMAKAELAKLE